MNFGKIKEQVEIDIGADVPAATMGRWVDSAQIEIAKRYGKRMTYWYPPAITALRTDIEAHHTTIPLDNALMVHEPPDKVIIGHGGLYEVVKYNDADHAELKDVERGQDNTQPLDWPLGTAIRDMPVARMEHDLPQDILTLHEVRDLNNKPIFEYHVTPNGLISVFSETQYYIVYTRVPEPIDYNDNDAEPEVHTVFHNDIIMFCLSRYWQSIAEAIPSEENKAQLLLNEFTRSVELAAKHLKRNENQQYTIGYKLW